MDDRDAVCGFSDTMLGSVAVDEGGEEVGGVAVVVGEVCSEGGIRGKLELRGARDGWWNERCFENERMLAGRCRCAVHD